MENKKVKQKVKRSYKSISISCENKNKLEDIMRTLESYHKKNMRVDKALSFLLIVFSKIKNPEKLYKLIK